MRLATEGALLGGLIARGVAADLGILSDGAPQFVMLVHAACWVHAERPLAKLVPHNDAAPCWSSTKSAHRSGNSTRT